MSMPKLYPYCEVFYKTEDSIGWNMAIMNGDKETVNKKCLTHNWFKYEIFSGNQCVYEVKDEIKYYKRPDDVHLLSYWIYWQELDKWFIHEDEIIPYPSKKCEETDDISFSCSFDDSEYNYNDPDDFDKVEDVYVSAEIFIKTNMQEARTVAEITMLYDNFEGFIENLKNNKFAVLHIEEFSNDKYIAWEKDNKVRFMVHDYSADYEVKEYVPITLDVLIDKDIFYSKFEKFYSNMKSESESIKQEIIEVVKNKGIRL